MPHARTTDPMTSHEAAASVTNLTATKRFILWLFDKFGYLTDEELYAQYCRYMSSGDAPMASSSGVRSRRAELTQEHYLFNSGRLAKTASGRNAIIWTNVNRLGISDE
jgi:hypothetical protein